MIQTRVKHHATYAHTVVSDCEKMIECASKAIRFEKIQGSFSSAYLPIGCDTARSQYPSPSVGFMEKSSQKPHVPQRYQLLTVRAALTMTACLSGGTELLTLVARPLIIALRGLTCRASIFARATSPPVCPEISFFRSPGFFWLQWAFPDEQSMCTLLYPLWLAAPDH